MYRNILSSNVGAGRWLMARCNYCTSIFTGQSAVDFFPLADLDVDS